MNAAPAHDAPTISHAFRLPVARRPAPRDRTLANVLANQGVVSGLTGQPLTEAAILGIGGGLGAGYILWEFRTLGQPILTLGFRNQWQYPWITGWTGKTLERLQIEPDDHETGGAKSARAALEARLDAGRPVIAAVDLQSIGSGACPTRCRAISATPWSSSDGTPVARISSTTEARRRSMSRPMSWRPLVAGSVASRTGSSACEPRLGRSRRTGCGRRSGPA